MFRSDKLLKGLGTYPDVQLQDDPGEELKRIQRWER